ncbi:UBIQUITIN THIOLESTERASE PROTEIN OTUB [Salix purpurea]|uniref:UBIQUITIN THIOLESTERASE PROTEIN OTUB n=1 Tax=Salix purpurea TaxID=77065 RepID=A0A9Q0T929_SALPP|nr:UBIQUITIN THIOLESTERASE PROTEIN OTUB [Salix purpurea]
MQNQEGQLAADGETEVTCGIEDWANFGGGGDGDVMQQQSSVPFVGDKEPLSALAAEYQSGSPILLQKIEMLGDKYVAIRRTRGDGNCFFRSFMFSYLEHILEKQDRVEVDRIKANVEECRKTLQSLGYVDFTFEDFFALFLEQLDDVLQGNETSIRCPFSCYIMCVRSLGNTMYFGILTPPNYSSDPAFLFTTMNYLVLLKVKILGSIY